jgi:thiol-disulfide isomerase/thioredoxin
VIRRTASLCLAGLLVIVGAAACSASHPAASASQRPGTCLAGSAGAATIPAVPTSVAPAPSSVPTATGASPAKNEAVGRLPSPAVDCFDGSGAVRLDTLTRPAVINLWASYCVPCHTELPRLEAFAKAAGASVAVIGVDTADVRGAAQSVIGDLGLTYPMVFDPDQRIYDATAGRGLPATLFVASGGQIRYVYESGTVLDTAHLAALVATYLGVTVHG